MKPSWRMIKFYKWIHDSTILSINMPFQANLLFFIFALFLSFSLFFSFPLTIIQCFLSQSYDLLRSSFYFGYVSNIFVLSYKSFTLHDGLKDNAKNHHSRFSLWFLTIFIYFPFFLIFFLILSYALSLSLSLSLSLFLSLSLSRTLSWSFTLRDLLRSLYLTMIYLHITYTTSQLFGSPFLTYMILLLHPSRRGRGCLWCIMYDYEACISITNDVNHTLSRAFPQWCLWTLTIEIYSLISPTLHTSHASDTFIATSNILTISRDWQ